ncbi:hypothetical protein Taro_003489 [Colocasia esculenta]|uniref:Pentatricopeptide repeat-containing protein n=1 Tax=Colocasia esculenta TaxID=4460 RepID=A0A843TFI5_COLES|nr:hypothetical protein [Colocasia esculenta]
MTVSPETCALLLQSCKGGDAIRRGRQLHLLLLKWGLASSRYYGNCLLQMYTRCGGGTLAHAHQLFDDIPLRNCFTWNSLIDAYSRMGDVEISMALFDRMPQKNTFSWNAVISGLARTGELATARRLFEEMPVKDAVAWNCVMHGYVRRGNPREALKLYKTLNANSLGYSSPWNDNYVLATAVNACAHYVAYNCGRQIHAHILVSNVEYDLALNSALVDMYSKCGDLDHALSVLEDMSEPDEFSLSSLLLGYANQGRLADARRLFDKRRRPGVVLWNSMLTACVSNGHLEEAVKLFNLMVGDGTAVDSSTLATVLSACTGLLVYKCGRQVHAHALKVGHGEDVVVVTALADLYSKSGSCDDARRVFTEAKERDTILLNSMITAYSNCGSIQEARNIFNMIPNRSLISWNSMLVGYSQNGFAMEALELFSEMHRQGLEIDKVAFASALSACASLASLGFGEQIFALATTMGLESDHVISTSLIDLYCKCGDVADGRRLFDGVRKSDEAQWNSMLMGYAANGCGTEVLSLFEEMRKAGVCPNEATFVAVLSGCCHCGLVDEGWDWFHAMKDHYKINPTTEHYSCIVDLLVRAGKLGEAMDFIGKMPFKADASMWTSLLRGCQAHGDDLLGSKVAERLMALDPRQAGVYVQLSSMYAGREDWGRSALVRKVIQESQIRKNPGCSWLDR